MTRRLISLVLAVVAVAAVTAPAFARRRALSPGGPGHCAQGTVAEFASPSLFTTDATHVYWIDDFDAELFRAPLSGGQVEDMNVAFHEYVTWSMTTDATTIYIAASPGSIINAPVPGFILTVPKSGGPLATLVSGISTPFDVEVDDTHVYWAAAGTLDFNAETIPSDGKIERARKDGSQRQTLAEDLSAPTDVALEGDQVWYGETGFANDDPTVGVYRVPKAGGAAVTLNATVAAAGLAVATDAIIVAGALGETPGVIRVPRNGTAPRLLAANDEITGVPVVFQDVAYYMTAGDDANTLWSVPVDGSATAKIVRDDLYFAPNFFVDDCGFLVALSNADLERVRR